MTRYLIDKLRQDGGIPTIQQNLPDDLFIVCASFEDRTTSATSSLANNYAAKRAIIYFNAEFMEYSKTKDNLEKIQVSLRKHCSNIQTVEGSLNDAQKQFSALKKRILECGFGEIQRVTIDVTSFNREALLVLMALLRNNYPSALIRVLYVSPMSHGDWLSQGFREVRNIIGFPGLQRPSRPTVLLALSGFEPDRVKKLIDEHEPRLVLLGLGDPPTKKIFLGRNYEEQKTLLVRQDVERFEFPANSINGCASKLEEVVQKYINDYNIILAPMSTKLSTLGAYLMVERHPDIQLTCCIPGQYNMDGYSKGEDLLFTEEILPKT
jgi:hypothetical protein